MKNPTKKRKIPQKPKKMENEASDAKSGKNKKKVYCIT
jgi:hypothetical protein